MQAPLLAGLGRAAGMAVHQLPAVLVVGAEPRLRVDKAVYKDELPGLCALKGHVVAQHGPLRAQGGERVVLCVHKLGSGQEGWEGWAGNSSGGQDWRL